jgi:hypothetical protein
MLGISDAWSMSRLSHRPSDPAYYIEDCRISQFKHWWVKGNAAERPSPARLNY